MMIADDEPGIIMITETIPKAQVIPLTTATITIPGYTPHMNCDPDLPNLGSSGMRGITIYVMYQIKVIEVEFQSDFEEQLWIRISLRERDSLLIGCIYRSISKVATVEANKLSHLLRQVINTNPTHLFKAGNFNYSQINWTYLNSSGSDNHYTRNFIKTVQDYLLGLGLSDHACLHFDLNCYTECKVKDRPHCSYHRDYEQLNSLLEQIEWE